MASIHCRSCGYDLRLLARNGRCPECATPLRESFTGPRLATADPRWLRKLALGANLLALGAMAGVAGLFALVAAFLLLIPAAAGLLSQVALSIAYGVVLVCMLVGAMMLTAGAAFVTAQDPREQLEESPRSVRRVARLALWTSVGLVFLTLMLDTLPLVTPRIVYTALTLAMVGTVTVTLHAGLRWLAALAERLPNRRLVAWSNRERRRFGTIVPLLGASLLLEPGIKAMATSNGGHWSTASTVLSLVIVGLVLAFIAGIERLCRLLIAFRKRFAKRLRLARGRPTPAT